jgi:hypothetical protein
MAQRRDGVACKIAEEAGDFSLENVVGVAVFVLQPDTMLIL